MLEALFHRNFLQRLRAVRFGEYQHRRTWWMAMFCFSRLQLHVGSCVLVALLTSKASAFEVVPIPPDTGHSVFRLQPLRPGEVGDVEAVAGDLNPPFQEASGVWVTQSKGVLLALPSLQPIAGTLRGITAYSKEEPRSFVLQREGRSLAEAFRVSGRGAPAEATHSAASFTDPPRRFFAQDFRPYLLDSSFEGGSWMVRMNFGWEEIPPRRFGPHADAGCIPLFASFGRRDSFAQATWRYLYVAEAAARPGDISTCAWPAPLPDRVPLHLGYFLPRSRTLVLYGWGRQPVFAVVDAEDGTPIRSSATLRRISEADWIRQRDAILSGVREAHADCARAPAASSSDEERSRAAACLLALQFETYR